MFCGRLVRSSCSVIQHIEPQNSVVLRGFAKKSKKQKQTQLDSESPFFNVLSDFQTDANAAKESLLKSLEGVQARRASPSLLAGIDVNGSNLSHIAHIAVRDPRTLVVTPHDGDQANVVLSAINSAPLGLNASLDKGTTLKVPVPRPSDDLRAKLRKRVADAEDIATSKVRLARQAALKAIRKQKDSVSKDELRRVEKDVDASTTHATKELSKVVEKKIQDISK